MSKDENVPPDPLEQIPLVREVNAQNSVVAGTISQLTININNPVGNAQEILRLIAPDTGPSGNTTTNDPLAAEINATLALIDRCLFEEALEELRSLRKKCGSMPGGLKSHFRIANNIGVCLMGLGRFSEAKAEFNKALSIEPDNDTPRLNLAAAYLNADDPSHALLVIDGSPANISSRGKRSAVRITALSRLERYEEIESFIERETWSNHDAHVQLAVATAMALKGETKGLDDRLRVALDNEETALEAHKLKGKIALGIAVKFEDTATFKSVSKHLPQDQLKLASSEFQKALALCPSRLGDARSELLAYCGVAQALLGESEQALKFFEASHSAASSPNALTVANHATVLMEHSDFSAAARLIRRFGSQLINEHPHVRLLLGAALIYSSAYTDVVDLLANIWRTFTTKEERVRGAAMVIESYRHLQHATLAQALTDELTQDYADHWEAWFFLGRHFAEAGEQHQSLQAYQKALSLAGKEDRHQTTEAFGYRQALWGDYAGCVATLQSLDKNTLGNNAAQALVVSLYNTEKLSEARTLTNSLLTRDHVSPQVIEIAASIASRAGDLDKAIELQSRLIRESAPRIRDINFLASLLLRKGDKEQAAKLLAVDAAQLDGNQNAHDLMVFAYLLSAVQDKRALTYGYRSWERGRNQANIQLGYVGLVLQRERSDDSDLLETKFVAPGTTVTLSVTGRSDSLVISILRNGDLTPDAATWVEATDPWADRLIGKSVGDQISGATSPLGQTTVYQIKKIQSNLIRAVQETMSRFNDRFPDAAGLRKLEIPEDDPLEITKLLIAILGNSGHVKKLVDMYNQGILPLATLADALNRSIPSTWVGLTHDESCKFRFSLGADRELDIADQVIKKHRPPVYLDYSALMTLVLLNKESREIIKNLIGPINVVQSLIDDLHACIIQAGLKGTGEGMHVSIGEDGRLVRTPLGDERGFLAQVQEIALTVALPCATYSQFDAHPATREVASRLLGEPTSDLLWEASTTHGIVLCDDQALKHLAWAQHQIPTASIQAIALAAHKKGGLTRSEYSIIVEQLAAARYSFISIDQEVITSSLERHYWRPTTEVMALFSCLDGPDCDPASAAKVGAEVLKAIVLESASAPNRDALIHALLARLTTGRDVRQISAVVLSRLKNLLVLAPLHLEALRQIIRAWVAARS